MSTEFPEIKSEQKSKLPLRGNGRESLLEEVSFHPSSRLSRPFPLSIILLIQEYVSTDIISTFLSENADKIDMTYFFRLPSAPFSYLEAYLRASMSSVTLIGTTRYMIEAQRLSILRSNMNITVEAFNTWYRPFPFIHVNPYVPPEFVQSHYEDLGIANEDTLCLGWPMLVTMGSMTEEYAAAHMDKYIESAEGEHGIKFRDFISAWSHTRRIPLPILRQYVDSISWNTYCRSRFISMEFIEENIEKLSKDEWTELTINLSVPPSFLIQHADKINIESFITYREPTMEFIKTQNIVVTKSVIYENKNLPLEIVLERGGKTMWKSICRSKHVTEEVLRRPDAKIYWKALSANPHAPMRFIEENLHKVHWKYLCSNPNVPVSLIKKNLHRVNWSCLSDNESFWLRLAKEDLVEELLNIL